MTTDSTKKTIKASPWELPLVNNYLEHCVPISERRLWKVEIERSEIELRSKKS